MQRRSDGDGRTFDPGLLDEGRLSVYQSLKRVEQWIESHHYEAYEPFDGLSSPLRRLTFGSLLLDRLLMQAVRQSPINLRPLLGIKPLPSTKGRGYMAAGYLEMFRLTNDKAYAEKARGCLDWLMAHKSPRFKQCSWANHFDFASRGGRYSKDESIIVWTALIGQSFLDGFEATGDARYLEVADSACSWILSLPRERTSSGTCLSYHAVSQVSIHNANMLGAALLARTWRHAGNVEHLQAAAEAMQYSCARQRPDGSWWYAEELRYRWVDNFHTGYNLDSVRCYTESTGDDTYRNAIVKGLEFYKGHFFREDGCPRYYHDRTQPIDSQCAAQAIETLAHFSPRDSECLELAQRVASWTIRNMQDPDGHFYYRMYPLIKAKAPMLHWAQATTYRALTALLSSMPPVEDPALRPALPVTPPRRTSGRR
jgi:rhamnogalacturonyl hydrolase YesR